MEFISMQELIEKLSPHDKAALIHVVEIHDKYCQQCTKHRELKNECTDQPEVQLIDTTTDHIEAAYIINCQDHGSDKAREENVNCKDQDPYNDKPLENQGWSDTPLCMDVDNEEQSDDSNLQNKDVGEKGLVDGNIEVGGMKTTKWAVQLFKKWLKQNGINHDFEYLAVDKIAEHVKQMGKTKTSDTNLLYSPQTMNFIRSSVMQYLNSEPYKRRISQAFFKMSTENKKTTETANMHDLSLRNPITQPDLRKIYASGIFGNGENYTPKLLLYKVWFEMTLHFSNFLRKNGSRLRREELKIATDEKGRLFCTFCLNEMVDTRWIDAPRIYSMPGNPFCPMKSILLYISHLNPYNDLLFQKPSKFFKQDGEWYTSSPLSQHTMKKIMKVISKSAGLSIDYPNICVRETAYVILYEAGLWDEDEYKKCWVRRKDINVNSRKEEIFLKLQQYIHGNKSEITQPRTASINKQAKDVADPTKMTFTISKIDKTNVQVGYETQTKQQDDTRLGVQQTKNKENTEEQTTGTNQWTDATCTRQSDTEKSKMDGITVFDYINSVSSCLTNRNKTSNVDQSREGSQSPTVTSKQPLHKHVIIRAPYNSVGIESIQSNNSNLFNPAYEKGEYDSENTIMANKKPFMPVLKVPPTSNQDTVMHHQQVSLVSKLSPGCSYMIPHTSWSDNQGHVNYLFMNTNQCIPKTNVEQKDKLPFIQIIDKKNTQERKYVNCKENNTETMMEKTHSIQDTKGVTTVLAKQQECLKTQVIIQRKSSSNDSRTCKVTPIVRHKPTENPTKNRSEQTKQQHANIKQKNSTKHLDVPDIENILHKSLASAKVESYEQGNRNNNEVENVNISEEDRTTREKTKLNMNTNLEENIAPIISFDEKRKLWVVQNMDDFLKNKLPSKSDTLSVGRKEMPTKPEKQEKCNQSKISSQKFVEISNHNNHETTKHDYKMKASNIVHLQTLIQEKVHNFKRRKQTTQEHVMEKLDTYSKINSLHVVSGAQKVEVKEKLQKSAFDEVTDEKNLSDRQNSKKDNFIITDIKSIDSFNTGDSNWRADENRTDENNNSENISGNMVHIEVKKIPETVVNNTDPKIKSESNFDDFLPKFQQQFSQRKDKIAQILKKIQEDSKRLEILKTKRTNTKDLKSESESYMEHCVQNTQYTEISTKTLAEDDKNKLPHEFVEKASHTGYLMKPKAFVFKKRKPNKPIVQKNIETKGKPNNLGTVDRDDKSETQKERNKKSFSPLKLAFRKKEGNEYEIIKCQNSNHFFYSPSFGQDSTENRNILQKKESNKIYGEMLAENRKRKSTFAEKDKKEFENSEFYSEQNNEQSSYCTSSVLLPFKKRIRMNHSYQTKQHNCEEEDQLLDYSLTEKEIFSDSDWSLSDEPSLLKCVNTATFNFADLEHDD
ncbi:KCTD1_15 [Mytilus coruscus]|uniref:KCTD1_15 n=1 Tax=Mytilus coruscus TaxID=42192 RepID=A0A6J8D154_MYTCO|nr:KCTD1_15 [Mytilus coruscus]